MVLGSSDLEVPAKYIECESCCKMLNLSVIMAAANDSDPGPVLNSYNLFHVFV